MQYYALQYVVFFEIGRDEELHPKVFERREDKIDRLHHSRQWLLEQSILLLQIREGYVELSRTWCTYYEMRNRLGVYV